MRDSKTCGPTGGRARNVLKCAYQDTWSEMSLLQDMECQHGTGCDAATARLSAIVGKRKNMNNNDIPIRIKPRISSRGFSDFCIVWFVAGPVQTLGLFILPGLLAYLISGSWKFGVAVPIIVYLAFLCFSVWSMTLSQEGIRFHRLFGSPKFLPWRMVHAIDIAPRWELITKGWFWPLLPAREMTASLTSLQHYRISWGGGFCYFPPADTTAFEQYVARHLQKPVSNKLERPVYHSSFTAHPHTPGTTVPQN